MQIKKNKYYRVVDKMLKEPQVPTTMQFSLLKAITQHLEQTNNDCRGIKLSSMIIAMRS